MSVRFTERIDSVKQGVFRVENFECVFGKLSDVYSLTVQPFLIVVFLKILKKIYTKREQKIQ